MVKSISNRLAPTVAVALAMSIGSAHPLGNFSVNHYARLEASSGGLEIHYVMDLAEIPTFELLREWGLEKSSARPELEAKAREQARVWVQGLSLRVNGAAVDPVVQRADLQLANGAGNLPLVRISVLLHAQAEPGRIEYEDRNYEGRAGWKEIVIAAGQGAHLESASHSDRDHSAALTSYPADPLTAPPQDLRAEFRWAGGRGLASELAANRPAILPIRQRQANPAPPPATITSQTAPPGSVVRNDFLSRLLRQRELPVSLILLAMAVAMGLGAAHALTPGHGKTIVAAYLVGSRGTLRHAVALGALVTFTHTISVYILGLVTLFLFRFIVPEKVTQVMGVISGLSIVAVGAWMLRKQLRGKSHSHHHPHGHDHAHHHPHSHEHAHRDGHSHVPDGNITWGSLAALAVSGGLVPCESALILLLSAISIGRAGLGLLLLLAFSLGLSAVLMGVGGMVVYARHLLPDRISGARTPWMQWAPVASAAVVLMVGLVMTCVSSGLLPARWLVG